MPNKEVPFRLLIVVGVVVLVGYFAFNFTSVPPSEGRVIVKNFAGGSKLLAAECANHSFVEATSDYILEGTIETVESKWDWKNNAIYTYSDFKIESYLKGNELAQQRIQIITNGGCVAGTCQSVEDTPIMSTGRARLYLRKTDGNLSIHGCVGIIRLNNHVVIPM